VSKWPRYSPNRKLTTGSIPYYLKKKCILVLIPHINRRTGNHGTSPVKNLKKKKKIQIQIPKINLNFDPILINWDQNKQVMHGYVAQTLNAQTHQSK
jgi:hypothetical protein